MEARVCLDDGLEAVLDLLLHKGYGCALELLEHDQLEDGLVYRALALARELELNEVLDVLGLADAVEEEVDHLLPASSPHIFICDIQCLSIISSLDQACSVSDRANPAQIQCRRTQITVLLL